MLRKKAALSQQAIDARRRNAMKSTGPRTAAGKRRAALNALKYGVYNGPRTLQETLRELGEEPEQFQRLLLDLMAARQPADAVERMLVEDIATLAWKKRRLDRAQEGLQLRSLELMELERHRQALQVGRETSDTSQAEVLATGLRRAPHSPARFGEILSSLELLTNAVERRDFSKDAGAILTALYGQQPTLRGAEIIHLYEQLQEAYDGTAYAALKLALMEETRDVTEEYALYLQEHVHVSTALRNATLAPTNAQWAVVIRHEYTIDRLIERKLKLLMKMQAARRARDKAIQGLANGGAEIKNSFFAKTKLGNY